MWFKCCIHDESEILYALHLSGVKELDPFSDIFSQGPGQYPDVVEDGAQVPSHDDYDDDDDNDDNDDDEDEVPWYHPHPSVLIS